MGTGTERYSKHDIRQTTGAQRYMGIYLYLIPFDYAQMCRNFHYTPSRYGWMEEYQEEEHLQCTHLTSGYRIGTIASGGEIETDSYLPTITVGTRAVPIN